MTISAPVANTGGRPNELRGAPLETTSVVALVWMTSGAAGHIQLDPALVFENSDPEPNLSGRSAPVLPLGALVSDRFAHVTTVRHFLESLGLVGHGSVALSHVARVKPTPLDPQSTPVAHAALGPASSSHPAHMTHSPIGPPRPLLSERLSESESRVLRYLPTNLSAPEIAHELCVSVNTVKTHLRHLYAKLGVHRRREAVDRGRALGLLPSS
jgi:LuxR family maltose regulon positive regulatory protein